MYITILSRQDTSLKKKNRVLNIPSWTTSYYNFILKWLQARYGSIISHMRGSHIRPYIACYVYIPIWLPLKIGIRTIQIMYSAFIKLSICAGLQKIREILNGPTYSAIPFGTDHTGEHQNVTTVRFIHCHHTGSIQDIGTSGIFPYILLQCG